MQDEIDNNSLSHRTARGTLIIFIQNLVVGISASLFFIFIARFLPTISDLGLVNGLQWLIELAVLVAGLGLYFSASRFASYYLGAGRASMGIVFNNILKSAGHSKIMMTSATFALTVQLIISVITIPILGAMGAALSRSAGYSLMFLIPSYHLRRLAGRGWRNHYDKKALQRGILGSVVMGSIIVVLNSTLDNAYYFPLNLIAGFISYIVFLRFSNTMNIRDFEIINNIFSGRLSRPIALVEKIVLNRSI